jgi:hypothetical protein
MNKPPVSVTITLFLIPLNALVWLAFAIITASGLHPAIPEGDLFRWGMSILAFLTCVFLIVVYFLLRRQGGVAYYLMLGMLALISLLSVTDEFGLLDLLVLVINVVSFLLLIKDRAFYLQRKQANPH